MAIDVTGKQPNNRYRVKLAKPKPAKKPRAKRRKLTAVQRMRGKIAKALARVKKRAAKAVKRLAKRARKAATRAQRAARKRQRRLQRKRQKARRQRRRAARRARGRQTTRRRGRGRTGSGSWLLQQAMRILKRLVSKKNGAPTRNHGFKGVRKPNKTGFAGR